jgi:hypothetical protein
MEQAVGKGRVQLPAYDLALEVLRADRRSDSHCGGWYRAKSIFRRLGGEVANTMGAVIFIFKVITIDLGA